MVFHFVILWLGFVGLIVAAAVDVRLRLIPNPVVVGIAIVGFGLRALDGATEALESLALAVVVFIPLGLLAGRKLVGGGDAKMIAAATLLVQPRLIPEMLLTITLAGGVLAIVYLASHSRTRHPRTSPVGIEVGTSDGLLQGARTASGPVSLPYGVAISIGVALVLLRGGFGCSSGTYC